MFLQRLQEFAHFRPLRLAQFGKSLRNVPQLARHHRPAVGGQPPRYGVDRRAIAEKPRPGGPLRNVVILLPREGLHFIGARFNGGGFAALMPSASAAAPAAPAAAANGEALATITDQTKCTNCKTCYQDMSEVFEKTRIVVDGVAKEVGRIIPGVLEHLTVTPELKAKVAKIAANCDAEIIQ